jgi:WD40 repeat protein
MKLGNLFCFSLKSVTAIVLVLLPWASSCVFAQGSQFQIGEGVAKILAISPHGELVAIDAFDFKNAEKKIILFEMKTQKSIAEFKDGWGPTIQGLTFSSDGKYLLSVASNALNQAEPIAIVKFWDLSTGKIARTISAKGLPLLLSDKAVLTCPSETQRDTADVFDLQTGNRIVSLKAHSRIDQVASSEDGKYLATVEREGTVRVWEFPAGKEVFSVGNKVRPNRIMFSPAEHSLAVVKVPGLTFFDLRTGKSIGGNGFFPATAISMDGKLMALRGEVMSLKKQRFTRHPDAVHVLSSAKNEVIASFAVDAKWQSSVIRFSPDGRWLLATGGQGILRLWDVSKLDP